MIDLPMKSGEVVTGKLSKYFPPYATVNVGDFLKYNPAVDKMCVVHISERPEYAIKSISKHILKNKRYVEIVRL